MSGLRSGIGKRTSTEDYEEESTVAKRPKHTPTAESTGSVDHDESDMKLPEELLRSINKESGVLMIAGQICWDLTGKRDAYKTNRTHPNLNVFHRFTDLRYRLIVSGCASAHSVIVTKEGKAMTFGRSDAGQLGLGNTMTKDFPEEVPNLKDMNIIRAATGKSHTLFLTDHGVVYACGDNRNGQCGVGNINHQQLLVPTRINYKGPPIVKVACGANFSMILDCKGGLYSFGMPEYGQLGHNTDGKYFVTANKIGFHFETSPKRIPLFIKKEKNGRVQSLDNIQVVDVACGNNHTVVIDTNRHAFSWGFGGFGRLGHAEPKDEMVPRLIKFFDTQSRGVCSIYCGGTYSLAINDLGALFLFGQTKKTGEANMYPKPVQDLAGWKIHSIGAGNTSIVVAAEDSLIVWGASPTYGELGLGDLTRSSSKPMEVKHMEGTNVTQVTMGFSHTLLLCNDSTVEVKAKLSKMPEYKQ